MLLNRRKLLKKLAVISASIMAFQPLKIFAATSSGKGNEILIGYKGWVLKESDVRYLKEMKLKEDQVNEGKS